LALARISIHLAPLDQNLHNPKRCTYCCCRFWWRWYTLRNLPPLAMAFEKCVLDIGDENVCVVDG